MTVAAIFINLVNRSQPVSSGLAVVLNSETSPEEVEAIIKEATGNAQTQTGATIESISDAIKNAIEGKASITELMVITVNTEIFG